MRQLAAYSLEAQSFQEVSKEDISNIVDEWLRSKGDFNGSSAEIVLRDGRTATVERATQECTLGVIEKTALAEPTESGTFVTTVEIAETLDSLVLSVQLAASSSTLTPQWLDIRRPRIILRAFELNSEWRFRSTQLFSSPLQFSGAKGGDDFISLVWDKIRSVPVVAVSREYGLELHPNVSSDLASDLAGVAIVAQLDNDASWRLTNVKDKVWSCYGGAIRIYWPGIDPSSSPFEHHKLWTPRSLLMGVGNTDDAARRIRSYLRRAILGQSAFAIAQHSVFSEIRKRCRHDEMELLRSKASSETDYRNLAEKLFKENDDLQEANSKLLEENKRLSAQAAALELALRYKEEEKESEVESATEAPPANVEDAVLMAVDRFKDTLVFGKSAYEGVSTVLPDAGPPEKILTYFRALDEMTVARRSSTLGTTMVKWLQDRGVVCSGESDTIVNSRSEMSARTWDDGCGSMRRFETHLKPKDGTSPDQCVRIYFDYDEVRERTIIGWVGRHPGT